MEKRKVIFDTDIGSDDAVALAALILSEKYDIIGITTTHGNLPVENTTRNALRLTDFLNAKIPGYRGCAQPMVRHLLKGRSANTIQETVRKEVNGEVITIHEPLLPLPESDRKPEATHACSYIVDTLRNATEKIILCAIGPLTNLGVALTMAPDIVENIDAIYVMGGGLFKGNRSPIAEANFYDDPEAAEIVLNCGAHVVLNPLEGCESGATYNFADCEEVRKVGNAAAEYIANEIHDYVDRSWILFGEWIESDCVYDYATVAALVDPGLVTDMRKEIVHVDCSGGMADGSLVADRRGTGEVDSKVDVIYAMDSEKTHQLLIDVLKNYKG